MSIDDDFPTTRRNGPPPPHFSMPRRLQGEAPTIPRLKPPPKFGLRVLGNPETVDEKLDAILHEVRRGSAQVELLSQAVADVTDTMNMQSEHIERHSMSIDELASGLSAEAGFRREGDRHVQVTAARINSPFVRDKADFEAIDKMTDEMADTVASWLPAPSRYFRSARKVVGWVGLTGTVVIALGSIFHETIPQILSWFR